MSKSFDLNRELIKATITYLVPVIIGTGVSIFGPVADFAWSEVLRTWTGLVVLGTLIVTALVVPRLSVWFAFAIFAGLLVQRISTYRNGPKFRKPGYVPILFSGFYEAGESGEFKRTGK